MEFALRLEDVGLGGYSDNMEEFYSWGYLIDVLVIMNLDAQTGYMGMFLYVPD